MLRNQQEISDLQQKVNGLIGAEDLKRYLYELAKLYDRLGENGPPVLYERAVLLSIKEGDGLDTWIAAITECWRLILELESIPVKYYELKLPDLLDAGDARKTSGRDIVLHTIQEDGILESPYVRRILCVDITKWIDNVEGQEFRAVLSHLRQSTEEQFVLFRIPAVDEVTFHRVREAIGWFMNVDPLYCPPFAIEEYMTYACMYLERRDVTLKRGAKTALAKLIQSERRDRNFCGFKTVRRIADDMIYSALRRQYGEGAAGRNNRCRT